MHPRLESAGSLIGIGRARLAVLALARPLSVPGSLSVAGPLSITRSLSTPAAWPAPLAATTGTSLAATRALRTRLFEGRHLIGGKDLGEFGLRLRFEVGDLLFLVICEIQLLFRKARDEVKPGSRPIAAPTTDIRPATTRTAPAGTAARAPATGTTTARPPAARLLRRRATRRVIGANRGRQRDAQEKAAGQKADCDTMNSIHRRLLCGSEPLSPVGKRRRGKKTKGRPPNLKPR